MKINGRKESLPVNPLAGGAPAASSEEKVEEAHSVPENAVSVDLSESSRGIMRAREMASGLPDIRTDMVSEIKDAIEDGSYQVESGKIARKMVDTAIRESAMRKVRSGGKAA